MTYLTDPIGDLLTRMRNAQHARHASCRAPYAQMKHQLCDILQKEGWIEKVEVAGEGTTKEVIVTFVVDKPLTLERISKPGRRVYASHTELLPVLRGFGMAVLTTSEGVMSDKEARKRKIGGEVLCTVS